MVSEIYSLSVDFTSGLAPGQFHNEILADSSITTTLIGVNVEGDVVAVVFVSALSGPEKTALDADVAAHVPNPALEPRDDANLVHVSGDQMTGTLYTPNLSGTTISGSTIFDDGNRVVTSINSVGGPAPTITTSDIGEGTNLYYTEDRVNANPIVSGHSISIAQNTTDIATISGLAISSVQSGASLGTGEDVFAQKNGTNLEFKSLSGISNMNVTSDADHVIISGTINTTSELPEGSNLYYTAARVSGVIATQAGLPNGLATLNPSGVMPNSQVPPLAITDTFVVASSGAQVALPAEIGDVAVRTDESKSYILRLSGASVFSNWQELLSPTDSVTSVNGKVGVVVLTTTDIAEGANLYYTEARVSANATVTQNTADLINVSGVAFSAIQSGTSLGTGEPVFSAKNGTDLEFNSVSGLGIISVSTIGDTILFSGAASSGEPNTSSNDGTGFGLAKAKVGVDLPFKSVSGLSNIVLTSDTDVVYFSGTINDTDDLPEGSTNLYYTEDRVNANPIVSGHSISIAQNTTDIATVSGIAIQNQTDISTVSGIATQNQTDITNVSGIASTAIQSGTSLGDGDDIFSAKNGTDLEFRTVSGVGNVAVTIEGDTVVFSGTGDGNGDVIGPSSATDNAIAIYDGTTGKLIKNSAVILDPSGTVNTNVISGTIISGNSMFIQDMTVDNLDGVLFGTSGLISGSATTTELPEGVNLYYTEVRVNANAVVSGHSVSIAQNTTDIATVSGLTITNASDIAQNTTDIATVSGIATQNQTDIATVSGIASTAIQSGVSLGSGDDIFSAKNGTDLEFNTVSGVGNVSITVEGNTVVFSGTGDGNGDVVGPASATDNAIAVYDGTTGKLIKNSSATVSDISQNATDVTTVSGIATQNTTNISTISGIATQNSTDIVTVSGLTVTNANDIAQNVTDITTVSGIAVSAQNDINTVSGIAVQNSADISTVSGIAIQNQTDIANVSGVAFTAIQSGVSLGNGDDIFSSKNGTDLEFNTVSGVGNVSITVESNVVVISGTGDGNGDVVGPASATDDAIAVYDGTTGKLIKNSSASVSDITQNTTDITTVSGIAVQNSADIITVSGLTVTNANDIAQNVTDIATVSGIAIQNQTDISTVSGIAVQNQTDIATVSGIASTAIQSGVNVGAGNDIFSAKNGTDLEFRTVSGVGNVAVTVEGDTVVFSGTGDGAGDVVGPASATDDAIAVYDGTTGKLIKNSSATVSDISQNTTDISTVSGIAIQNQTDIVTVSGLTVTNASDIAQNTTDISTVSGISIQNQTDISTVSGIATQNTADIANVSGVAFTAVQSASNVGGGDDIFSTKNGTDLEFNTVSGVGNVSITVEGNTVVFSGTGDGNGDVIGPASATDNAVAVYDGTTGKLIKDSSVIIDPAGTINANTVSGTNVNTDILTIGTLDGVLFGTVGLVSGSATTTQLPEGSNLYYTDQRVNDNPIVSGHSLAIAQNTTDIATVSGITVQNATDISTVSGIAIQNSADIITVSGLTVTNANNISQNTTDIATVSGIAVQNTADIANVSGVAFTAIQSGVSVGTGDDIFSAKNGTDLEFNTVSGVGAVSITTVGNTVVFSGTDTGGTQESYASAYDTTTQNVAAANTLQDITFDTNAQIDGWTHTGGSADFTCPETALYLVAYNANVEKSAGAVSTTAEIVALFNGSQVAGSQDYTIIDSNDRGFPIANTFIVSATATQILKLQLASTTTNTLLNAGGTTATVKPSITISITKI